MTGTVFAWLVLAWMVLRVVQDFIALPVDRTQRVFVAGSVAVALLMLLVVLGVWR